MLLYSLPVEFTWPIMILKESQNFTLLISFHWDRSPEQESTMEGFWWDGQQVKNNGDRYRTILPSCPSLSISLWIMSKSSTLKLLRGSFSTSPGPSSQPTGSFVLPCRKLIINYSESKPSSAGVRTLLRINNRRQSNNNSNSISNSNTSYNPNSSTIENEIEPALYSFLSSSNPNQKSDPKLNSNHNILDVAHRFPQTEIIIQQNENREPCVSAFYSEFSSSLFPFLVPFLLLSSLLPLLSPLISSYRLHFFLLSKLSIKSHSPLKPTFTFNPSENPTGTRFKW